jgi:hypothetical protein
MKTLWSNQPGPRVAPRRLALSLAAAGAAGLALLAAGCGGGGGSSGVANVAGSAPATTTTSTSSGLVAFSECMRSKGVTNIPDPQQLGGGNVKLTLRQRDTTPRFHAAMRACSHLIPELGGAQQDTAQQIRTRVADGLSFANCMRGHGVSRFPDPDSQGQLTVAMVQAQGIDVHSPEVLRDVQACLPASHGMLTPAKIREALANAGG